MGTEPSQQDASLEELEKQPVEMFTPRSEYQEVSRCLHQILKEQEARLKELQKAHKGVDCESPRLEKELPPGVEYAEPSSNSETLEEDEVELQYIISCINYLIQQTSYLVEYRYAKKSHEEQEEYCAKVSNYFILEQYIENDKIDAFLEEEIKQFGTEISPDFIEHELLEALQEDQSLVNVKNKSRDCMFL